MNKHLVSVFAIILICSMLLISCDEDPEVEIEPARITFNFEMKVGDQELVLGQHYVINGTTISFDVIDYYVGGIIFTQADGSMINLEDQYLLASQATSSLNGDLEVSDITSFKFFVGVDALTNSQTENDFTRRSSNDPLGLQDPAMHWNWNTGYKFLRVDGDIDQNGDGTVETGVAYHIGTDDLLTNFEFDQIIPVVSGQNNVRFILDLNTFFTGVDLITEVDTHTANNLPLAQRLQENLKAAISIQ